MKYRKKPVIIEAIKWDGNETTYDQIVKELDPEKIYLDVLYRDGKIHINTLEGEVVGDMGDFIIKGVKGELYPCKPDIFEMTYEKL